MKFSQLLWTALIILPALPLRAQNWFDAQKLGEYDEGYIVSAEGDTIQGRILYNYPAVMARKITFIKAGEEKPQRYKGKELKGYYFAGNYWESHEFNDGSIKLSAKQKDHIFLYPLALGKLSVYEHYFAEITDWVKYEDGVNKVMPSEPRTDTYVKKEGEDFVDLNHIRFMRFHKGMSKFLSDCPALATDISEKKLGRIHIVEIAKRYNACEH